MNGEWPLLSLALARQEDLVPARQRARRLAALLGFDVQDQTRIATAVSEVARNALLYAGGGRIDFRLVSRPGGQVLGVVVTDQGPGIAALEEVLEGRYRSSSGMGLGLIGTRRLMDEFDIRSTAGQGTMVRFGKALPRGKPLQRQALPGIAAALAADAPADALSELQAQNQELLASLSELRQRQQDMNRLNAELEDTNRGVVALYAELDQRAEELRLASELKSRFLSDMSHELRTPLNSIHALSQLLLDNTDGPLTTEQQRQVGYIQRSAQTLTELVNDLLDLAKVEAGKAEVHPSSFTVAELFSTLRGVLRPLQTTPGVDLVFEEDGAAEPLFTDEGKLSQVLRNLVSNALKFTERGEVRVTVRRDTSRGTCCFTVQDTGIGIAAEDQEHIFEEFTQLQNPLQQRVKGTGLGLPLSRRLAELLGGSLGVESVPGRGSVFSLVIPARLVAASAEPDGDSRRILVIDDEDAARYVMRQLLSTVLGGEVTEAADGEEGLRLARQLRPDAILLDLRMPKMDGFQVLQALHGDADLRGIPVLVCTSSLLGPAEQARLRDAAGFLPKSALSRDTLREVLLPALAARRQSP